MIPVELSIEGLHSYKDRETVAFDGLVEDGLFGIFGPTGSGKSTLLDAITLALYGRIDRFTGSAGGQVTPMMHVDSDELTVTFTFRLGGHRYQAHRRFARTSDGTVQQRDAVLEDLSEGTVLASQAREVTGEVEALLGMDFDQFTRAVFLPQGKFAQFLEDNPADRLELLEDLFGLGRFGELLRERASRRRSEVRQEHNNLQGQLEQLVEATEEGLAQRRQALAAKKEEVSELQARCDALAERVEDARKRAELTQRLDEATGEVAELEARQEEVEAVREELSGARAAQEPHRLLGELTQREDRLEALSETVETVKSEAEAAEANLEAFLEERDHREAELQEQREHLAPLEGRLSELETEVASWGDLEARQTRLTDQLEDLEGKERAPLPPGAELTVDGTQELLDHARRGVHLVDQRDRARAEHRAQAERVETLEERLATAGSDLEDLTEQVEEAGHEVEALEERVTSLEVAHRASVLADHLETGEPCPVCGARDHPTPTQGPTGDLEPLRTERDNVRGTHQALQEQLAAQRTLAGELDDQLEGARQTLEERAQALTEALEAEADHRDDLPAGLPEDLVGSPWPELVEAARAWTVHLRRTELSERLEEIQARREEHQEAWITVTDRLELEEVPLGAQGLETARQELDARRGHVQEALADLESREEALREEHQAAQRAASEQAGALEQLEAGLQERTAAFEQALEASPFTSREEVTAAYRVPEQIETLDRKVREHEQAIDQARKATKDLAEQIDALDLGEDEATEILAEHEAVQDALREATEALGGLKTEVSTYEDQLEKRGEVQQRFDEVDRRLTLLEKLHHLLRGRGFVEFLARARFDVVLEQASRRLSEISGGQYHLSGNPREIAVIDLMAGARERDLRTLSGGERFMVSLSLALALSDAIQHERGGGYPPIEFFFLDEGFGSLDHDTLGAVMHLLQDLCEQGIHVGLITHVEAAKRYVPAKLEVDKATETRGSRVRVIR